jgi:LemA protein
MIKFLLFLVLLAAALLYPLTRLYNGLRQHAEGVKRAQSNLVGELRKRATLVNQLIDVCKGYGDHEKLTHLTVSAPVGGEADPAGLARATSQAMSSLNLVVDRFPELKANETYKMLMGQMHVIEDSLQDKREALNLAVEAYNRYRGTFPAVLIAGQLGFPEAAYFSTDEAGLDASAQFRTDDGEILRTRFVQIGQSMGGAAKQIGSRAGEAIQAARAGAGQAPGAAQPAILPPVDERSET